MANEHSPGALTARRFFRNRLALRGLVILGLLFLFSFPGGLLSPYGQDQVFYRQEHQSKEFAAVRYNEELRFWEAPGHSLDPVTRARLSLAIRGGEKSWEAYRLITVGRELYALLLGDETVGFAAKERITGRQDYGFAWAALQAYHTGEGEFSLGKEQFFLQEGLVYVGTELVAEISRYVLSSPGGAEVPLGLQEQILQAVKGADTEIFWEDREFTVTYDPAGRQWSVREQTETRVWDSYASPSRAHPLGTDKNGMDMLTRLMYGGRVSLVIGFLVVLIAAALGVVLGGIAGYFGGIADELVMRLVDVFYCIPSTPLLIILGALMDGLRLDPEIRVVYLMLVLGLLGWPSIARLVRGQILSLRQQEFMTAAESVGLSARRRIFRHLLPNVMPQLIVACTMSLGSTILTEATLSFLGLGIKFPFASWGNIMNDVANVHVLTSYPFVWIPAGICLVLAVLGFNFVGDGLRDALDPKMKR